MLADRGGRGGGPRAWQLSVLATCKAEAEGSVSSSAHRQGQEGRPGEIGRLVHPLSWLDGAVPLEVRAEHPKVTVEVTNLASGGNLNRPGMLGGSIPWKRGWSYAVREVSW